MLLDGFVCYCHVARKGSETNLELGNLILSTIQTEKMKGLTSITRFLFPGRSISLRLSSGVLKRNCPNSFLLENLLQLLFRSFTEHSTTWYLTFQGKISTSLQSS